MPVKNEIPEEDWRNVESIGENDVSSLVRKFIVEMKKERLEEVGRDKLIMRVRV